MLYPDKAKSQQQIKGFSLGFKIPSFISLGCTLVHNLKSVDKYYPIVKENNFKEIKERHVAGPLFSNYLNIPRFHH